MELPNLQCEFVAPNSEAWLNVVYSYLCCLIACGVPLTLFAFWFGRGNPWLCIPAGTTVAVSIPLVFHGYLDAHYNMPWVAAFLAGSFGVFSFFKLWNIAFEQQPEGAFVNFPTFMQWFLTVPEPQFLKGETRKMTASEIGNRLGDLVFKIFFMSFMLSALYAEENVDLALDEAWPLLSTPIIRESFRGWLHVWWMYSLLSLRMEFSSGINMATSGFTALDPGFKSPLWESRSYKEVWGTRWNVPVQRLLQRTSYVPMRRLGHSRTVAAVTTFLVSGLLHEYYFLTHNWVAYIPGLATLFFLLMGVIMLVEKVIWDKVFPGWLKTAIDFIPSPIIATMLVLPVSIPAERFFIRSWLEAGVVESLGELVPHVQCASVSAF
eukprot:Nitzschia sp. Nitz4//scaffold27_size158506//99029//100165//NITZ4_002609-RA/size158506-processed-gene-0.23-mRNA-1//1//CDS//3329545515//1725//frame0